MKSSLLLSKASFSGVGMVVLALASSGCSDGFGGFMTFENSTNLLVTLTRADGSAIPDVVSTIQDKFGFRAQKMNLIVPKITVHLDSPSSAHASQLTSTTLVTDWATVVSDVVNDALTIPFTLHIDGLSTGDCGKSESTDCPVATEAQQFVKYFAAQGQKGIESNLELRIMGQDDAGNSVVKSVHVSKVTYQCIADLTQLADHGGDNTVNEDYSKAVQCTGKVEFVIE